MAEAAPEVEDRTEHEDEERRHKEFTVEATRRLEACLPQQLCHSLSEVRLSRRGCPFQHRWRVSAVMESLGWR